MRDLQRPCPDPATLWRHDERPGPGDGRRPLIYRLHDANRRRGDLLLVAAAPNSVKLLLAVMSWTLMPLVYVGDSSVGTSNLNS